MNLKVGQNIIPSINFIAASMPEDITDLEKVRYIYINLGKLFSYDYRVVRDESVISKQIDYASNEINRYQTCYQISEILTILINGLVPTSHAKIVERKINGRSFNKEHIATEVTFKDNLKILLDLTLDLSNIQAGLRTKEFGFTTNINNDYDIISLRECEEMDEKLGFIADKYTDDYINEFKNTLKKANFSGKTKSEILDFKIRKIKESLAKDFKGEHEAIRYINTLFNKILTNEELSTLKQFNLSYENTDELNFMAIFSFNELGLYYSYSNELGFNKINASTIENLLKSGWKTNSNSIQSIFDKETNKNKR